jgi:hypothetical protein
VENIFSPVDGSMRDVFDFTAEFVDCVPNSFADVESSIEFQLCSCESVDVTFSTNNLNQWQRW